MTPIRVVGAGPAGCSAAISAAQEGAEVRLIEKSQFPRHKVCGEFLSPEIAPLLESLGVWNTFLSAGPARIHHLELHFGSLDRRCKLPELAYGLSRYRFDQILFEGAITAGALPETGTRGESTPGVSVMAKGRSNQAARGRRLFGFKSHFQGPVNDAVELYFFSGCYVGINPVENGITNVCGLGPEDVLKSHGFDFDSVVNSSAKLAERLRPMQRMMRWHSAGPLVFQNQFQGNSLVAHPSNYPAGDALSFVDPFTGSGLLSAVLTGRLAGLASSRNAGVESYIAECRQHLQKPFFFSSLLRAMLANGWAERLAGFVPSPWLVRLTRPQHAIQCQ